MSTLEIISEYNPYAKVAIGRELTKMYEEVVINNVKNIIKHFKENTLKGEIVGMLYKSCENEDDSDLEEKINILKSKNFKAKEISTILAALYNLNKNDVYRRLIQE